MSISASSCLSQPPTVTFNLSVRTYKFYCTHLSVCLLVCLPGSRNLGGLYVCTLLCLRDYISLRLLPLQNEQLPNRLHAIRCLNCLKVIWNVPPPTTPQITDIRSHEGWTGNNKKGRWHTTGSASAGREGGAVQAGISCLLLSQSVCLPVSVSFRCCLSGGHCRPRDPKRRSSSLGHSRLLSLRQTTELQNPSANRLIAMPGGA